MFNLLDDKWQTVRKTQLKVELSSDLPLSKNQTDDLCIICLCNVHQAKHRIKQHRASFQIYFYFQLWVWNSKNRMNLFSKKGNNNDGRWVSGWAFKPQLEYCINWDDHEIQPSHYQKIVQENILQLQLSFKINSGRLGLIKHNKSVFTSSSFSCYFWVALNNCINNDWC